MADKSDLVRIEDDGTPSRRRGEAVVFGVTVSQPRGFGEVRTVEVVEFVVANEVDGRAGGSVEVGEGGG